MKKKSCEEMCCYMNKFGIYAIDTRKSNSSFELSDEYLDYLAFVEECDKRSMED